MERRSVATLGEVEAIALGSPLFCGAAKLDITPPLHVPYLGFDPRQGTFEGIHDRLFARAAAFSNGEAHVAVLSADALGLSNDLLGPGRDFIAEVREQAATQTDLSAEAIMVAATHAHSTPETYGITRIWEREDCAGWIETLAGQLASVIVLAWRDRRPARLATARTRLSGMSRNRRDEAGPLDEELVVLLAEREGGGPVVLSSFACHPVTVQVNPLMSADFPGAATALVERELAATCGGPRLSGGPDRVPFVPYSAPPTEADFGEGSASACCLFLQGAAGDINPIRGHTGDWRDVETYGLMLGGAILGAVGGARLSEPMEDPVIAAGREVLHLEAREAPSLEEATAALQTAEDAFSEIDGDDPEFAVHHGAVRRAQEVYRLAQFGTDPVRVEVQAVRIGDLGIAAFPGELFCSLGLRVKEQSPAPVTMIAECANGCAGYLAPREAWEQGGYEVSLGAWCRVAAGGPEKAADAAAGLLARLFRG